ncbi:uncharacterized protein N7479_008168 [Penicillium vulpinum]|nr:uncharacterized protein N7479_008168 [Penicillium vulpinum]KAJ5961018.1 hypothetical protein N7479_008168 [Penicillium vulpinum]
MLGRISSISILLALAPLHALAKTCFAPDGSIADHTYQPCIAIVGVDSMCCSLNSTHPDTCQPNGLCLSNEDSTFGANYWRNFCTDETWDSPNCLSKTLCDKSAGGSSSWTARLVACSSGAFCCGTDKSCCLEGTTFTLADTLVNIGINTTAADTANTTAIATTTTTATATATATATVTVISKVSGSSNDHGPSNVVIGVGVGAPLAVLAFIMLGVGFFWGRRKTQAKYNVSGGKNGYLNAEEYMGSRMKYGDSKPLCEVSGQQSPRELPGSKGPFR